MRTKDLDIDTACQAKDMRCVVCGRPAKHIMHTDDGNESYDMYEIAWRVDPVWLHNMERFLAENNIVVTRIGEVMLLTGRLHELSALVRDMAQEDGEDVEFVEKLMTRSDHVAVCPEERCIEQLARMGFVPCECWGRVEEDRP